MMTTRETDVGQKKGDKFVIDAAGESVGRVASRAAMILMGKNDVNYQPHIDIKNRVVVKNVDKVKFSGKKIEQKEYRHHSMHPGGLKRIPAKVVAQKDRRQLIILAVNKMLPKNNTRTKRLLRLSFE